MSTFHNGNVKVRLSAYDIDKEVENLKAYCTEKGYEILPPKSQYEVLRVLVSGKLNIVYRGKNARGNEYLSDRKNEDTLLLEYWRN